jgi:hypothetical protein
VLAGITGVTDKRDAATPHGDRVSLASHWIHRADGSAGQDKVSGLSGGHPLAPAAFVVPPGRPQQVRHPTGREGCATILAGMSPDLPPDPSSGTGLEDGAQLATGGRPVLAPEPEAPAEPSGPTLRDPLAEALRIIGIADGKGLQVRLMGGLSFHARCPEWTARVDRERRDIDLATRSKDRKALQGIMEAEGYTPDRQYNALYGHKQLYFVDTARSRPVDVLIDRMEMCHRFDFAERLTADGPTVPLAEMLLSKLQIARINRKDILDALALLSEYPLGKGDAGTINVDRLLLYTSADWGWWRTLTGNLDKLRLLFNTEVTPEELDFRRPPKFDVRAQLAELRAIIDAAPKSMKWKMRSQVGERVQWFEEPEEVGHGR